MIYAGQALQASIPTKNPPLRAKPFVSSFLLTSEEKEAKKTATSKASFKGGCNRSYSSLFH